MACQDPRASSSTLISVSAVTGSETSGSSQQTPKSHEPQIGDVLANRYRLESVIGRGGFGIVYKATHLDINRQIALKVLLPEWINQDPELAIRFRRESLLASRLRHPNTITLYDHGQCDTGMLYMSMEFVQGRPLSAVLREESPIPAARLVPILQQILSSLTEAHNQGIVHRDLKPSNIMLTPGVDGQEFVKVLDFGVAKALSPQLLTGPDMAQTLTQAGRFCGTPRYMAPEQFRGGNITPSCDLYALGLISLELLTGKPAIRGRSMVDIIVAQVTEPDLVVPTEVDVSNALRQTLNTALKKDPTERYPTAERFARDLGYWQATSLPGPEELQDEAASTIRMSRKSLPKALSAAAAEAELAAFEADDEARTSLWQPDHFNGPDQDDATQAHTLSELRDPGEQPRDTLRSDSTPSLKQVEPYEGSEHLRIRGASFAEQAGGLSLGEARLNIEVAPPPMHRNEHDALLGAPAASRDTEQSDAIPSIADDTATNPVLRIVDGVPQRPGSRDTELTPSPPPGERPSSSATELMTHPPQHMEGPPGGWPSAPEQEGGRSGFAPDPRESPVVHPDQAFLRQLPDADTTLDISRNDAFRKRLMEDRRRLELAEEAERAEPPPRAEPRARVRTPRSVQTPSSPSPRPQTPAPAPPEETPPEEAQSEPPQAMLRYVGVAVAALVVVLLCAWGLWALMA
ncbi:MAG: hypothetical protein CMH57_10900 [Myxococcales bacterium]|nr:hypothetical protein [Myxococcales bacterium]